MHPSEGWRGVWMRCKWECGWKVYKGVQIGGPTRIVVEGKQGRLCISLISQISIEIIDCMRLKFLRNVTILHRHRWCLLEKPSLQLSWETRTEFRRKKSILQKQFIYKNVYFTKRHLWQIRISLVVNELGFLSNFSLTPFYFYKRR